MQSLVFVRLFYNVCDGRMHWFDIPDSLFTQDTDCASAHHSALYRVWGYAEWEAVNGSCLPGEDKDQRYCKLDECFVGAMEAEWEEKHHLCGGLKGCAPVIPTFGRLRRETSWIPGICTNPGQRKSPEASEDSQSLASRKKSGPRPVLKSIAQ